MGIRAVPSETVPASVYRLLLPHERRVITVRLHPARLVPSAAMAFGGVLAALAAQPMASGDHGLTLALWLLAGFLVVQSLLALYSWLNYYVMITSQRILLTEQSLLRSVVRLSLPLSQVQDIRLHRPTAGRLLGYGTLVSDSARLTLTFIRYPENLYLEVSGLIFKDPGSGED
jgi:Bacterial PH domain